MPQQISQDLQQGKRQKQISGTKKNGLDKTYGILFAHFLYLGILFVTFCHFFHLLVSGSLTEVAQKLHVMQVGPWCGVCPIHPWVDSLTWQTGC